MMFLKFSFTIINLSYIKQIDILPNKYNIYLNDNEFKGSYNILVAVAGGDTIKEIQSAIFNDADIVVVWKNFYQADGDTAQLAQSFLKEI